MLCSGEEQIQVFPPNINLDISTQCPPMKRFNILLVVESVSITVTKKQDLIVDQSHLTYFFLGH